MTRVEEPQTSKSTGRVLLYVRAGEDVSILRNMLAGMAAEGVVCAEIRELCRSLGQEEVDVLLLTESALADGALRILAETLQHQPHWSDLPVLFVASGGLESPLALQAMRELPNVLVLDRPVRTATLTSTLRMALRIRDKQRQVRDLLQEREGHEQVLRESEARLHLALGAARMGAWQWEVGTQHVVWSPELYRLLGYERGRVKPTHEAFRRRIHPQDLARWEQAVRESMERCEDYSCQFRVVWADGSVHWVEARGQYACPGDEGATDTVWMRGVLADIEQRRQAEEALREWNATLESKVAQRTAELKHRTRQLQKLAFEMSEAEDRERERLAHLLHDDLQQELAAAKFHLSIVRSRAQLDSSAQEIIATVDEMLKDAIGKSRSLSHELSPGVLRQSELGEILRGLANEMQAKHGLAVHVQGGAQVPSEPVKAFLYRTAQELLFNAVKHAQVNEVRVRVRPCGGCICLAVSDRGRGFDPGKLRETAGFGLLSIRERIELLGGRMKIRSAPGHGSTFFVVVPNGTMAEDAGVGPRAYPMSRGHGGPPLRIVLADDHEVVRQGLAALLSEEESVQVVGEATNGREAVDLADRLHPDVVVMDVLMPVMNGDEATRQIKEKLPETRIVSLSMREEPEIREKMGQAGADSYVLKTAPYKELLATIRGQEADVEKDFAGADT